MSEIEQQMILRLQAALTGLDVQPVEGSKDPAYRVPVADLSRVATWLRGEGGYDYLSSVTAVDRGETFTAVYHLYSMTRGGGPLVLQVNGTWDKPELPSVTPIWPAAELQEREVFDLFGISISNHPDLRRIMMWDGFPGHPLRKTYENRTFKHAEMLATMRDREVPHVED